MPHDAFVEEITDFYCRTQRAFLAQLIRSAGYDINWSDMDGDLLMIATIQSAQGATDLLRQVLGEAIK